MSSWENKRLPLQQEAHRKAVQGSCTYWQQARTMQRKVAPWSLLPILYILVDNEKRGFVTMNKSRKRQTLCKFLANLKPHRLQRKFSLSIKSSSLSACSIYYRWQLLMALFNRRWTPVNLKHLTHETGRYRLTQVNRKHINPLTSRDCNWAEGFAWLLGSNL